MSKNYALLLITMLSATVLCANHENGHTLPVHLLDGLTQNSTEPSASWKIDHLPLSQPLTNGAPTVGPQATFSPGDIIITEIMQNPKKISDNDGEWFELYNTTSAPIDLIGWTIKDLSNGNNHTIASNVVVQPGGYALLMRQGNPAINGGLTADYVYGFTVSFRNDGDEVVIEDPSGHEIDRVAYDDGTVWPNPDGASMSLDPSFYNATDNDNGIYWCEATSMYDPDNRGTPGAANAFCFPPVEAICKDIDVELGSDGMADITANQIDDGSNSPFGVQSLSLDISTFSCTDIGENTVTLIVTDQAGNDDSCQGKVTVEDNVAPDALCQNVTVQLNNSGNGSTTAAAVDNGSNDACGIASLALSQTDFGCADVGANTVTLTVTDANGNESACDATVNVEDNVAPIAACLTPIVEIQPDGFYALQQSDVYDAANSSDNCSIASVSFPATTFDCDDLDLTFPITVTIADLSGNTDNCTANVSVALGDALPNGWNTSDIGNVTVGNEYSFDPCTASGGEYTITGSGNNAFSSTTDNVAFASQTLCGNGMITAKLESITPNGYGGLMIRETTATGSKQVSIFSNLTNILRHESRATTNGAKTVQSHYRPFPFWLRLQRMGDWVFAYYSTTGTSFSYVHAVYVPMQNCVEIGLASFTYLPNVQTEAVFSNVSVSGNTSLIDAGGMPTAESGNSQKMEPELFPNPTNSQFTLRFPQALSGEATASLRNQVGQVVKQRQLQPGDLTTEWNVGGLLAGLYFMEIRQEGLPPQVLRVVKQ